MKYPLFLLLFFLFFSSIYAMPCPNGNGVLYKGDSIEDVLKQCGEPTEKKTVLTNVTTYKRLIYNRPHPYDQGYSQANILFANDHVSNIHIFEYYTVYMCRQALIQTGIVTTTQTTCGNWDFYTPNTGICGYIFGIGATIDYVKSVCGNPAQEIELPPNETATTEFTYKAFGQQQTIIFQNGKLADWK